MGLEQREPFMNWLLHPQKSWREHHRVHAAAKAAKLDDKAKIAAEHNEALNPLYVLCYAALTFVDN